jgi:hypothetical protein
VRAHASLLMTRKVATATIPTARSAEPFIFSASLAESRSPPLVRCGTVDR